MHLVRVIAFNRPDVRNAFDTALYQEATAALRAARAARGSQGSWRASRELRGCAATSAKGAA